VDQALAVHSDAIWRVEGGVGESYWVSAHGGTPVVRESDVWRWVVEGVLCEVGAEGSIVLLCWVDVQNAEAVWMSQWLPAEVVVHRAL
jgi:hypothetical protein